MTSTQFLVTSDQLAMSHLKGAGCVDSHGDSGARNLLKFFMKAMQMKFWQLRGTYSSPFNEFKNSQGPYRRCPGITRVSVGAAHNSNKHVTWTLGQLILDELEFSEQQCERDSLYNERE